MDILYGLCVDQKESITNEKLRTYLKNIKSKGRAATLAKQLLNLPEESQNKAHRTNAALHALEQSIRRAERWNNITNR